MEREVHIWHDQEGRIMALGHVVAQKKLDLKATPLEKHGHGIITVRMTEKELHKLAETHQVDMKSKKLTPLIPRS
jgi:hypothetical protein